MYKKQKSILPARQDLSDQLSTNDRKMVRMECDLEVTKATLTERTNQLAMIQQGKSSRVDINGLPEKSPEERAYATKRLQDQVLLEKVNLLSFKFELINVF